MPISAMGTYWPTIKRLIEAKPSSILEIGSGSGRYGMSIRDFLEDICYGNDPTDPSTWKIRLEGVEIWEPNLRAPAHGFYYNETHLADGRDFLKDAARDGKTWDCVTAIDVVEHVPFDDAVAMVDNMLQVAESYVLVATPYGKHLQDDKFGNPYEVHQFTLYEDFFDRWLPRLEQLWRVDNCMLAVLWGKNPSGLPPPKADVFQVVDMLRDSRLRVHRGMKLRGEK